MRVASRRVAEHLRCNPAIVNGHRLFQSSGTDAQKGSPQPVPMSKLKDSFLDGTSSTYLEDMEEKYRQDPSSVDKSWASFFRSLGASFRHVCGLQAMLKCFQLCFIAYHSLVRHSLGCVP